MSLDETRVRAALFEVLRQVAPDADPATLSEDDDLREALEIDSMDLLNVAIGLHARLGVDIPEADYAQLTRLRSAVPYLLAAAVR